MSIVYDPATNQFGTSIPRDLAKAWVLYKMLGDQILKAALNPEPEPQVKTLEEMGLAGRPQLHRG